MDERMEGEREREGGGESMRPSQVELLPTLY